MEVIPQFATPIPYLLTLSFLVTYAALHFILLKPLQQYLDEREEAVSGARHQAEALGAQIDDRLAKIEARLVAARGEVADLRAAARSKAHEAEVAILAEARAAADTKVTHAVASIESSRAAASTVLRGTAGELSTDIVTNILGRQAGDTPPAQA